MTTPFTLTPSGALAFRLVPITSRARAAALVAGGTLLTALSAQLSFHLPWTPVPVTGQTFAVLLVGTALGMRMGAASMSLYVALGAIGLPFYAGGEGGWTAATGSTAGYLVGFVLAAALVGALADRRRDRNVLTALPGVVAGTVVIYALGAAWLARSIDVSIARAVELGVRPFLAGDALKIALLAAGLPAAWRLVGDDQPARRG